MNDKITQIIIKGFGEGLGNSIHNQWLYKTRTVKIDGVDMTVLPYGFLSQAIDGCILDLKSKAPDIAKDILDEVCLAGLLEYLNLTKEQ